MPTELHILGAWEEEVEGTALTIDRKSNTSVCIGGAKENVKFQDD